MSFCNGGNGGKSDSGTVSLGRQINAVLFFYLTVKTIGRYNIQAFFMFHADREIMITFGTLDMLASMPHIFQNVSQKRAKLHIRDREGKLLGKGNLPVPLNLRVIHQRSIVRK